MQRSSATVRAAGFSLLELVFFVALASALLAAALPRLSALRPALAAEQAARSLASDLGLARMRAVMRNARARVTVRLAEGVVESSHESEGIFVPEGPPRALPDGVRVDAERSTRVAGGRVVVTFLPRGNTADNATIALRAGEGSERSVVVSAAGRVRIR